MNKPIQQTKVVWDYNEIAAYIGHKYPKLKLDRFWRDWMCELDAFGRGRIFHLPTEYYGNVSKDEQWIEDILQAFKTEFQKEDEDSLLCYVDW